MKTARIVAGWVLHVLVAGLMIFSGSMKLFAPVSEETVEAIKKIGLYEHLQVIAVGEVITAVLLLFPRTLSLGVLLASSFWGGTIAFHMSHQEPYLFQAAFLILTWLGAGLREPRTFASFLPGKA
jgi:hypothetical protein